MKRLRKVVLSVIVLVSALFFAINSTPSVEVFAGADNSKIYKRITTQSANFPVYSSLLSNYAMYGDDSYLSSMYSISITHPNSDDHNTMAAGNHKFNDGANIYVTGTSTSSIYKNNPRVTSSFRLADNLYNAAKNGYLLINMKAEIKTGNDKSYLAMQTGTIDTSDMHILTNVKNTYVSDTYATDSSWKYPSLTLGQDKGVSGYEGTGKAINSNDIMIVFYNEFNKGVADKNELYINNPTLSITSSDTTAPSVRWELSEENWTSYDKTLKIYVTENQSGIQYVKVNGEDATYNSAGYYEYQISTIANYAIEVADNVNNKYTGLVEKAFVKIDKTPVSRLSLDVPASSHTKGITIKVNYTYDEFSPEHIYYTLDGSMPNTSSKELTVGDFYLDLSATGNKTYILTAIVIDEAGWQSEEIDIVRETFRIDDNRYKINVNVLHGSYEIVGAETLDGESEPHAWYGDIIGIKYLPNDGYELYKLYRNGREEASEDSYYVYQCQGDTTLDIKFRYRVNIVSYENVYEFEEGVIKQPEFILNTEDDIELSITTTKDDAISSLYNSGDYVVTWSIDNDDYIGNGVMNITITPVQIVVSYGDNSNFVYNGQIQEINYTITEVFDYSIKYYLNSIESDFLNAGNYTVKLSSLNPNYVITNGELNVIISKLEVNVNVIKTSYDYTSDTISLEYFIDGEVESTVSFIQNDEVVEFKNSGDYIYEIKPVDENNFTFLNNIGECEILKVDVYFVVDITSYHYTAKNQSLIYSMKNSMGEEITFVNQLNISYTLDDVVVDFREPGEYIYTFSTADSNYNLFNVSGNCNIEIVIVNVLVNKTSYEYTGSEIELDYVFTDASGVEINFEGIAYNIYKSNELSSLSEVGIYEYEFVTDDVYYSLVNSTGNVEIIVANIDVSVENTTFKYSEDGVDFVFLAQSLGGLDYTNNKFITIKITKDNNDAELSNVGEYLYEIISLDENIVLFGDVSGVITIECKEITAEVIKTYIYSGSEIVFEYSLSQDVSVTVNIPDSMINVDDYDYSIISNNSNYVIVGGSGKIKIIPKPINVNILNYDFTYTGEIQNISYNLTIDIENSYKTYRGDVEKEFIDAGTYKIIFTSLDKNYVIESSNIELVIKQKPVEIVVDNLIQTYNKDEKTIDVVVENNISFEVQFEVAPINVNTYPFKVIITNPNYIGLYEGNLVINKKIIDISPKANQYKIYGEVDGVIEGAIFGLCDGDELDYTLFRESGENVGIYKIYLNDVVSDNYSINYISDFYSINRRQIILKADSKAKIYGDDDSELTYQVLSGEVISGDDLGVCLYRDDGENVGDYKIYLNDNYNDNYKILFTTTSLFTIIPRDLNVVINNIETTYSEEIPLSYTISEEYDANQITGNIIRESGDNVGCYVISKGTLNSINYNLIITNGTYTIAPRELYITAINSSKYYGEEDNLTYDVNNLLDGDVLAGSLSRDDGENVGEYSINLGNLNNDNYHINFTPAKLTILKSELNIIIDDKEQVYGEKSKPLTYSVTGLKFDDILEIDLFRNGGENAGEYYISCYINTLDNYYIGSLKAGIYTIHKADLIPILEVKSFTYNGENHYLDCDFPFELRYEYSLNGNILDCMKDVGTYRVVAIFDGNDNYNPATSAPIRATIKKRQVDFILAENKYVADGSTKTPEFYFDESCGLNRDNVIYVFESGEIPVEAGEYKYEISIIDANYEGSISGILTIANSFVKSCGQDVSIECSDATFDDEAKAIEMNMTSNSIDIEDKNVVSSFTFENFAEEKDYIYTIRIKANNLKSASLYQMIDGKVIEIALDRDGDDFVFRSNNLNGEFFIAKDKLNRSVVATIALGSGVVVLGGIFISLKVIKARKLKKSKVSTEEVANYNIG